MPNTLSTTTLDSLLWSIEREIMNRHGVDAASRAISPLVWYINTGRASSAFLRQLLKARPVLVARDLCKGGSDETIINRICNRVGYQREG